MQDNTEVDLGFRLKFIRELNGLSQRELAKRAGVPHSNISMIEQGQSSPSINSLAKILGGFPMSLAHFFNCDLQLLAQTVYRADDLRVHQKTVSKGLLLEAIPLVSQENATQFSRLIYQPKAESGERLIPAGSAVSGLMLEGCLELSVNAEVSVLSAGDAFMLAPSQPHRIRNHSLHESVLLICITR